ncbi:MAG TPA: hypothetical protein VHP83_27010 [Aggregatilineaceae bacterium]|nr:hypothetical protein [Aggregatilineaceae bacterium]
MPIELTWMLPDKILLARWYGMVRAEDASIFLEELSLILDEAPRLLHIVLEASELIDVTMDAVYLYLGSNINFHPRRGRIAAVGGGYRVEIVADVINRISQYDLIRLFRTREEAQDFLLSHDTPPPVRPGVLPPI